MKTKNGHIMVEALKEKIREYLPDGELQVFEKDGFFYIILDFSDDQEQAIKTIIPNIDTPILLTAALSLTALYLAARYEGICSYSFLEKIRVISLQACQDALVNEPHDNELRGLIEALKISDSLRQEE